jgi:hypothetical protein
MSNPGECHILASWQNNRTSAAVTCVAGLRTAQAKWFHALEDDIAVSEAQNLSGVVRSNLYASVGVEAPWLGRSSNMFFPSLEHSAQCRCWTQLEG